MRRGPGDRTSERRCGRSLERRIARRTRPRHSAHHTAQATPPRAERAPSRVASMVCVCGGQRESRRGAVRAACARGGRRAFHRSFPFTHITVGFACALRITKTRSEARNFVSSVLHAAERRSRIIQLIPHIVRRTVGLDEKYIHGRDANSVRCARASPLTGHVCAGLAHNASAPPNGHLHRLSSRRQVHPLFRAVPQP